MTTATYQTQQISTDDLTALDLRRELDGERDPMSGEPEAYRVREVGSDGHIKSAPIGEVLWFPAIGRGGVSWGGDSVWSDASSVDDLLRRVAEDECI